MQASAEPSPEASKWLLLSTRGSWARHLLGASGIFITDRVTPASHQRNLFSDRTVPSCVAAVLQQPPLSFLWLLLPSGCGALNLPKRVPGLAPWTSLGWKAGGSLVSVTCTSTMVLAAVFLLGFCSSPPSQGTRSSSLSTATTRLHVGCVS